MVIVECDLDEYVITKTGFNLSHIHHVAGKGNVIKKLIRHPDKVGVVDKDPGSPQPGRLKQYQQIERFGDLELYELKEEKSVKLIIINPRIEEWLLKRAEENNINIENYGYPRNAREIHDIPKIEKQVEFQNFLSDLFEKDEEFAVLKSWLNKFEDHATSVV